MCGIAGLASLSGPLAPEVRESIRAMTGRIAHRGPDGDGFQIEEYAALGHRRLAIIDVAGGHQPLSNEDGSVWIAFNGEIYNHHPLRERLEARGHRFRTRSDTEAIVHAWEEFGESCVDHLQGMFAFAIWDRKRRVLFAARDRLGKKPFFYATLGGVLHFASEIKAIAASPLWNDEVDLSALEGYLSLGYFLAPATVYQHVRKLEPAHWLTLQDGRIETRRYWDVTEFDTDRRAAPEILVDLQALMKDAVASRLESEVPLGAFLSGGIDSGLIVSFMAETHTADLVTTSVGFGEAEHNELGPAGLTAARYGTTHHAEVVQPALDQVLEKIVAYRRLIGAFKSEE
jgi:asparagine synthase (glutamine-hydrolysing)